MNQQYTWDFFISHAGPDLELARNLYQQLNPPAQVFLDDEILKLGDHWPKSLPEALHQSLITIIIISPNTEDAFYVQEEIAIAIKRTRADPHTHRIIPVYVNKNLIKSVNVPFGLNSQHGLSITDTDDFAKSRDKLLNALSDMKGMEVRKVEVVAQQQVAVSKIINPKSGIDLLGGLLGVTGLLRPLVLTLFAMFVIAFVTLIIFMFIPTEDRALLLICDGFICLLLLGSILLLIERSLKYAPQIITGNINAG